MSLLIQGKAFYARIVGSPHANKFKEGINQWSFDLSVDEVEADKLLKAGMKKSYLRNKGDERGTFISFSRDATKADKSPGKPYHIVDAQNRDWDQNTLIGNGSVLNVAITLNERTFRGDRFLKPGCVAVQIWTLVPYQNKSQFQSKPADTDVVTTDEDWS